MTKIIISISMAIISLTTLILLGALLLYTSSYLDEKVGELTSILLLLISVVVGIFSIIIYRLLP